MRHVEMSKKEKEELMELKKLKEVFNKYCTKVIVDNWQSETKCRLKLAKLMPPEMVERVIKHSYEPIAKLCKEEQDRKLLSESEECAK